jgi:uncharacterized protein (TIGR02246 family)
MTDGEGARLPTMTAMYGQVAEGVRATIAAYAQALDDGRTDDVVALFCPDGVCEIPGLGAHQGHEAIRTAFAGWKPVQPQRHLVVNTLVTEKGDHEASAVSDVVFLLCGKAGWQVKMVGRYDDLLHFSDGVWRFRRRAAAFVTADPTTKGAT